MLRCTPAPSSSPARCVEPRQDVDPPAEVLGAARRGAHPQVQRRARAEPARQAPQRVVQHRGAGRAVVLEARPRDAAARASADRGRARRRAPSAPPRRRSRRSARAGGPPPGRGRRAGCRPSSGSRRRRTARARGRSPPGTKSSAYSWACVWGSDAPASRRSLTIRCSVGGVGVDPHPLAPHVHRGRNLLGRRQLAERHHRLGRVDDHLVRAERRRRPRTDPGWRVARAVRRARGLERRIQVRHHADGPAGRVGLAAVGPDRVQLGRRAVLVALGERIGLRVESAAPAVGAQLAARASGAGPGDDRPLAGQRVDAGSRAPRCQAVTQLLLHRDVLDPGLHEHPAPRAR